MRHISELDSPSPFKAIIETDISELKEGKNEKSNFPSIMDFHCSRHRERIDSEDFSPHIASKGRKETDFLQEELKFYKPVQAEDFSPVRRLSAVEFTDPVLIQLEV